MPTFCITGGKSSTPFPEEKIIPEMFEDRYFKPGIIHGGDYLIRAYLNDAHCENPETKDHNQFVLDYFYPETILEAAEEDPSLGDRFNEIMFEKAVNFCIDSDDNDFAEIAEAWPQAVTMTNREVVEYAKKIKNEA